MNRITYQWILLFLFIGIAGCYIWWYLHPDMQLTCILSSTDGQRYCVRARNDKKSQEAVDLLANVAHRCTRLVQHCKQTFPKDEAVQRLARNFHPEVICETLPTSELTAYSENKGEKIAFCLTKQKHRGKKWIDPNTLMFVAIHELAHVMSAGEGHQQEFWKNFKFLLIQAKEIGVYIPEDYKEQPKQYCGMQITDNPYYDY